LFEPEKVKDELTGANIYRANKANLAKLEEALAGNAGLREAADAFIKPIATRLQAGSPGMSSTEAYTLATEDFINKALPQGRAKEVYDFSEARGRAGGGGRPSKTPIGITTKRTTPGTAEISVYKNEKDIVGERRPISYGDPKTDEEATYSRSYKLNANFPVYLMQAPEDFAKKPAQREPYFARRSDGTYTIKSGFEYTNPIKSTVYFADKDINFYGPNPPQTSYTVRKGTPLDNETALNLLRQGRSKEVKKQKGYEVTAEMYVPYSTMTGVQERERPSVKIFIPEGSAGSIKKHIDMEKRKVDAFNASTPEETGEFSYFSNP